MTPDKQFQKYSETSSNWKWFGTQFILFFFFIACLFSPLQMVEASVPQLVQPDLSTILHHLDATLRSSYPVHKQDKSSKNALSIHPVEPFSQALYQIKHQVKLANDMDLSLPEALFHYAGIAACIKSLRKTEHHVKLYFAQIEQQLLHSNAPAEIRLRHEQMVAKHTEHFQGLNHHLKKWEKAYWGEDKQSNQSRPVHPGNLLTALSNLAMVIEKLIPDRPYNELDLERLPRRESKPVMRAPFQTAEQYKIYTINNNNKTGLSSVERITAEDIKRKAAQLNNDPLKIYTWVRNNIRYIPTYGFKKSATACLGSRKGNAFDISNLLVELLKASGNPARFVLGTIEFDEWFFRKTLGDFQVLDPALRLARHGGISVQSLDGTTVQMEHVWVETQLDSKQSDWIPMDAAIKPAKLKYTSIATKTKLAAGTLLNNLLQAAQPTEDRQIGSKNSSVDPDIDVPWEVVAVGTRFQAPPPGLQHQVGFQIVAYQSNEKIAPLKQIPMMELSDKTIQVTYEPATQKDQDTIQHFGSLEQTPPYLIQLKPVLKIGDTVHLMGHPVAGGTPQEFRVWFFDSFDNQDYADHLLTAGQIAVLGLDCQQTSQMFSTISKPDQIDTKALEEIIRFYFYKTDQSSDRISGKNEVVAIDVNKEALASTELCFIRPLGGRAIATYQSRITLDVQLSLQAAQSVTGESIKTKKYAAMISQKASLNEHLAIETIIGEKAISGALLFNSLSIKADLFDFRYVSPSENSKRIHINKNVSNEKEGLIYSLSTQDQTHHLQLQILTDEVTGISNYLLEGLGGAIGSTQYYTYSFIGEMLYHFDLYDKDGWPIVYNILGFIFCTLAIPFVIPLGPLFIGFGLLFFVFESVMKMGNLLHDLLMAAIDDNKTLFWCSFGVFWISFLDGIVKWGMGWASMACPFMMLGAMLILKIFISAFEEWFTSRCHYFSENMDNYLPWDELKLGLKPIAEFIMFE